MPKTIDITGQKFGRLTAIKFIRKEGKKFFWLCKCDCGNEKEIVRSQFVGSGSTKSCGCLAKEIRSKRTDITGQKFGKLTAIREVDKERNIWLFNCDCGGTKETCKYNITRNTLGRHCGCVLPKYYSCPIDISGRRFGKLTAIEFTGEYNNNSPLWLFSCDCGGERILRKNQVTCKKYPVKHCGCSYIDTKVDITGQRFGRLTAIRFFETKDHQTFWLFKCDCGTEKAIAKHSVVAKIQRISNQSVRNG